MLGYRPVRIGSDEILTELSVFGYLLAKTGSGVIVNRVLVYRPARTGSVVTVNRVISVALPASQD